MIDVSHRWIGEAFYVLTDAQAPLAVELGDASVGERLPGALLVSCQHCGERWTPEAAGSECWPHAAASVGRNDPCPCGSGDKAKRCHGGG